MIIRTKDFKNKVNMFIYLYKNNVSGLEYVGKSERSDKKARLREHKRSTNAENHKNNPLYQDIKLYGKENFSYTILEDGIQSEKDLTIAERYHILKRNSLYPNGYNLEYIDSDGKRIHSIGIDFSGIQQGIKKKKGATSKYVGVFRDGETWRTYIAQDGKSFCRTFHDEIIAAKEYDKMAIYLYGNDAKLNFESSKNISMEDINNTYKYFTELNESSKYIGVVFTKSKQRWRALVSINREIYHIKYVKDEKLAAEYRDAGIVHFSLNKELNFPEKISDYKSGKYDFLFKKKAKSSKYKGVHYYKAYKKYTSKVEFNKKVYSCGYFLSEEEAYNALLTKKRELGIL